MKPGYSAAPGPDEGFDVEVVCAVPERQRLVATRVSPGATAMEAVRLSGIAADFPEIDIAACTLGIWGQVVSPDRPVKRGDRVEIYRPLEIDPRTARMQLAAQGKSMGRSRSQATTDDRETAKPAD